MDNVIKIILISVYLYLLVKGFKCNSLIVFINTSNYLQNESLHQFH